MDLTVIETLAVSAVALGLFCVQKALMPSSWRKCAFLVVAGSALAAAPAYARYQWVSITTMSDFTDAQAQLQALVDANGHKEKNRLCVIGQQDGRYRQAYVYWPSENKLILWTPDVTDPATLVHSRRYLDLTRDVVKGSDVHGSTYLLPQTFVDETLQACATRGDHYTIIKSKTHG